MLQVYCCKKSGKRASGRMSADQPGTHFHISLLLGQSRISDAVTPVDGDGLQRNTREEQSQNNGNNYKRSD